jgi:hypothetical protein
MCLSCSNGLQPFIPLASPLIRAHGDVLELDGLCTQHVLLSRQLAEGSAAAASSSTSISDAELPQVMRNVHIAVSWDCDFYPGDFKVGTQHS